MKVVLISPYELGRQPFGLAEPAAWLKREGCDVHCLDLSLQMLEPAVLAGADLVAIYIAMHTATRIAVAALPRIKQLAPHAHLCVYGLYAPMNEAMLRDMGVKTVLGGEVEPALASLARRLKNGASEIQNEPVVSLEKIDFILPDRTGLPALTRYAHLLVGESETRVVGFAEGSRGCKHLCRHCPVVPVYQGKFRILQVDVVMQDIRQQIAAGAQHISFGDPDFLNGPTHAQKLVRALHHEFPQVTYDATIKIQHLLTHAELLPLLKETGCLFITAAVESVDDHVLELLDKNHTNADFGRAVALVRTVGIALAPTFVPFSPWTTLEGYIALLERLVDLELIESVPPIQLAIRLLVPQGSELLKLSGFLQSIDAFDPMLLGIRGATPTHASICCIKRFRPGSWKLRARVSRGETSSRISGVWRTTLLEFPLRCYNTSARKRLAHGCRSRGTAVRSPRISSYRVFSGSDRAGQPGDNAAKRRSRFN